ncbi:MAG TPA: NepR family anti-sigma factor [Microvirga sp.]|jgi:RNA polymerase sigma-70 factor (ECF subfamily)
MIVTIPSPFEDGSGASHEDGQPVLGRHIQEHLGRHLQTTYDDVARAPLPERFIALIEELERVLKARGEVVTAEFRDGILKAIPNLRAFALSLSNNPDRADDLVQDTILRAWDKRSSFQAGTNLNAWLFTILRNSFFSEHRKRTREVADSDGEYAATLKTAPDQVHKLEVQDMRAALERLSPDHREALLLVGAEGLSYEDTAAICGVAVGTIKSRVNRARVRLAELMGYSPGDFESDHVMQSALMNDE